MHDENDKPIDCNIYHPKYGYKGMRTYSNDVIAASFNTRHSYKDYETGETIYAPYYLQMLCSADGINFTSKDGKKVMKVDWAQKHQKRLAKDDNDFELIYEREYNESKIDGTKEATEIFKKHLIENVQTLIKLHKEKSIIYKDSQDNNLLDLAERFMNFIQTNNVRASTKIEAPEFALFCSIVDESNLFVMGEESKTSFCERVKERFKLPANPEQARKVFNRNMDVKVKDRYLKKLQKVILPLLDESDKKAIEGFINNKTKLYT